MYRQTHIPRLRACLWISAPDKADDLAEAAGSSSLIVPDGCMDLIVLNGQIVIAGADSTARMFHGSAAPTVGLRFDSGVLPQLLTTSAGELADRVTPLDAVLRRTKFEVRGTGEGGIRGADEGGIRSTDGDAAASVTGAARALLDAACGLSDRASLDPRPMALAERLDVRSGVWLGDRLGAGTGTPSQSVAEAAADFGYSTRQLRRLSAEWFGYGPKHLAKILRWQAARDLIDSGRSRTAAAAEVGYADAAHLRRDERSLIGS
ncbi:MULTISPECIES: helix-turn-helix domain-containing protein [unclassified Brevibacterium]|uniref:helix-turn-helix domain-containing protein n=1 Tax=unclassified Brevibacterium TaxID=2614124 RepID=UPI00143DFCC0|nr:helix-turn-helix domain-containing protein [Brevibacterium sp. S22]